MCQVIPHASPSRVTSRQDTLPRTDDRVRQHPTLSCVSRPRYALERLIITLIGASTPQLGLRQRVITAVEDKCLHAYLADIAARSAWAGELGSRSSRPALNGELSPSWPPRTEWSSLDAAVGNGSSFASPDGQLCGLFAVDVAGFSAEVVFITSGYVYENVICRRPSLVDPALFQPLSVRVKETRTRAWAYILGALPSTSTRGETRRLRSALSHFLPRCRRGSPGRPRPWRGARPAGSRRSRPAQPAAPASLARSDRGRLAAA
jgi:hypothetical protein